MITADKRFEKDYIRRWRVLAMLNNIKHHLNDDNINSIVDEYIKLSEIIDEDEWGSSKLGGLYDNSR